MSDQGPNLVVERMRVEFQIEENKLNVKRVQLRQAELRDELDRLDESISSLLSAREELTKQLEAIPN
jgi:peptidoglycan hydrolase CwlO-like protein